jgi:hypothetical protein
MNDPAAAAAAARLGPLLNQTQSVMLVELDGPRTRTVGIQIVGQAAAAASPMSNMYSSSDQAKANAEWKARMDDLTAQ